MKVEVEHWTIKKLIRNIDRINEQPEYQRGDVWSSHKKKLLVDSILRGIDIPKFYFRKLGSKSFDFEVADGQQRINSIILFYENEIRLEKRIDKGLDLSRIGHKKIGGKKFEDLPREIRNKFLDYKITVAIVKDAKSYEIRILFGRLQEGIQLNPAEKRNAIISRVGNQIDNFVRNHKFFVNCRISKRRYKHQDYLAHSIALMIYKNKRDLKADLLYDLYLDNNIIIDGKFLAKVDKILDVMYDIDSESERRIVNKFAFIDIFNLLERNYNIWKKVNIKEIANRYDIFEDERLDNKQDPRNLIEKDNSSKKDKMIYEYILAFDYAGSEKENIETRYRVYNYFFNRYIGR